VTTRLDDHSLARLPNVGVASFLGNTFHGVHIGTTVFNNEFFDANVSDWNIDSMTADFLVKTLTDAGVHVSPLTPPPDVLGSLYRKDTFVDYPALYALAAQQHLDTLIFVARIPDTGGRDIQASYGIFERTLLGLAHIEAFARLFVGIVDVKAQKVLAVSPATPFSGARSKDLQWKASFDAYSPEEKERLKQAVEMRIRAEVAQRLREMNLVPARP